MNAHESLKLLLLSAKITTLISFLPPLIGILKWRYFKEKPLLWMFFYVSILVMLNMFSILFVDLATKYYSEVGPILKKLNISNTFFIEPFYALNEIIFIGLFSKEIVENKGKKHQINWLIWLMVVFVIVNTLFFEGYQDNQEIGSIIKSTVLLYFIYLIIKQIFISHLNVNLSKSPLVYVILSLLISVLIISLLDFIANRMFTEAKVLFYQAHILVNFVYVISTILMSVGFYLVKSVKLR